jgi:predicted nucleic acid-binding protein
MRKLFLDTGYLIALEALDDQHHNDALAYWQNLSRSLPQLVTTSYVFDEVVTFFNCRNRHSKAVEIGRLLLETPSVKLIHVDEPLFIEAWRYFIQHSDKSYSLTDCVSFVVMKRHRIRNALTFDHHFVQAGFEKEPEGGSIGLIG